MGLMSELTLTDIGSSETVILTWSDDGYWKEQSYWLFNNKIILYIKMRIKDVGKG